MKHCLFAILVLFWYTSMGVAATRDVHDPTDCHADFTASPDLLNPMKIHFTDKSTGQINHWQWSFGDGATSTDQNPVHTYAAGGTYFVCLTVSDSDSGFLCHDVLCQSITVHQPGACIADYTYSSDSADPRVVKFTDKSTGNINSWHWDFGDGTVSGERNPSHAFAGSGKYRVCLSAYNSDSVSVCNDVKCDSLLIGPVASCQAAFSSELDSLNREPNTFEFRDLSSGDPNRFLWNFDDGSTSASRNVAHPFHVEGDHKVCLTVSKVIQGTLVCSDSVCHTVRTARYFNLGGHLFAGDAPINNPVSTGDTGVAYLYRKDGSRLTLYDTVKFTHLGYFAFPKILNGSYVVRSMLTAGSASYAGYFPTYYPQAMKWQESSPVTLTDSNSFASDVHLLPVPSRVPGPGRITGHIAEAGAAGNAGSVPHAEVILYDGDRVPLGFTLPNASGKFELDGLPYGAYYLYVEVPRLYSRLTPVWLDSSTPVADSLLLEVFDHDVTGIDDDRPGQIRGVVYPNPAGDIATLEIQLREPARLLFEIRSMTGRLIWSAQKDCRKNHDFMTIQTATLPQGVYLLSAHSPDGSQFLIMKLLRY